MLKILIWPILGWGLFVIGFEYILYELTLPLKLRITAYAPGILLILFWGLFNKYHWFQSFLRNLLERHSRLIDEIPNSHIGLWIVLAAGLSLYLELMMIRMHASYLGILAYFKNFSLLSCFLGLGLGYAQGYRSLLGTPLIVPTLSLQIAFLYYLNTTNIIGMFRNPIREQLTMGIPNILEWKYLIIVYGILIFLFSFNALCFIPLGQLISRLMIRREKLVSYGWNLIGTLLGILIFSLISYLGAPGTVWFLLAITGLIPFFYKDTVNLLISLIVGIIILSILFSPTRLNKIDIFSPYQMISIFFQPNSYTEIKTNNLFSQKLLDLKNQPLEENEQFQLWSEYFTLSYLFKPTPQDVLILGSGTGNDVAAALRHGAGHIDAVEIDPTIVKIGKKFHPEKPYDAHNVDIFINDARAYLGQTKKQYDLIVYGLLDSHSLLSSKSGGIRLESYVYTLEGLQLAKEKLKKNGVLCINFCVLSQPLGQKIFLMLKKVFDGQNPIVYKTLYEGSFTFLVGRGINDSFQPQTLFNEVTHLFNDDRIQVDPSTDNWPFLYMPVKKYPISYVIMVLILLLISFKFIRDTRGDSPQTFSIPCFFLGAGFMLLETKAITELARVYGSTWIVITIVIVTLSLLVFLANLLLLKKRQVNIPLVYLGLGISLLVSLLYSYKNSSLLGYDFLLTPLVLMGPLFFAGLAFSSELNRTDSLSTALSSNLIGAMTGGFLEYNCMYFGFRALYYLAILMYGCAFWGSRKIKKA